MSDFLTLEEQEEIDTLLAQMQDMPYNELNGTYSEGLRRPTGDILIDEQLGWYRLSSHTRKLEQERQKKLAAKKKSLRHRKPMDKRKAPWTQKMHTERKRLAKEWAKNPLFCVLMSNRYTAKKLDKGLWNEYIAPIWEAYDPAGLTVTFDRKAGTRENPWTIWNMTVVWDDPSLSRYLRKKGRAKPVVVWYGPDLYIYELSKPGGLAVAGQ